MYMLPAILPRPIFQYLLLYKGRMAGLPASFRISMAHAQMHLLLSSIPMGNSYTAPILAEISKIPASRLPLIALEAHISLAIHGRRIFQPVAHSCLPQAAAAKMVLSLN